jgi:hypothetical protein
MFSRTFYDTCMCVCWPQVIAVAYDNPIPGYATPTTSNLRLWDAEPVEEFDLTAFNAGDYDKVRRGALHCLPVLWTACTCVYCFGSWVRKTSVAAAAGAVALLP